MFGQEAAKNGTTKPIAPENTVSPAAVNGRQPTNFQPGTRRGVFATAPVASTQEVTWTLAGLSATARVSSEACGPRVSLPAKGNRVGLVLTGSLLLSMLAIDLRQRRQRRGW